MADQRSGARPATLADVARAAGVHVSTVSRVLRGGDGLVIRPETRRRIEDAAAGLGYRPNALARALRSRTTGTLGLLVPSLRNPVYATIVRGAFERAWARQHVLLLVEDRAGGDGERAYERLVEQRRVDGLLIAGARPDSVLPGRAAAAPVPFVFVNRRAPGLHGVAMREEDAGALAARHLLALGHRRLAHIAGPPGVDTAQRRRAGFAAEAARGGVPVVVEEAAFDEAAGHDAMARLLAGAPRPTAAFASSLTQAVGALAAVRAAGLAVPRDLSLLAYDDDPLADYLAPPLTTIRMPLSELGARAVDVVLDRIAGAAPEDVTLATAPALVERASTARPGRGASATGA